jgi:hypothetical protein
MENKTFRFDVKDLNIDSLKIGNILGFQEGDDRELVTELIEEVLKEAEGFRNIKAEYNLYPDVHFNNLDKTLEINNINFQINKIVFGQLKKSDSIAVFLCTAGEEIGIRSRKAMKEMDLLKGYIYDIVGSLIVDAAADQLQLELEKEVILTGKKITNRYSPGYCDWPVIEQHKLFSLLPKEFCGITLTESALMIPIKSMSGIIGLGPDVKRGAFQCNICDLKDCFRRREEPEPATERE